MGMLLGEYHMGKNLLVFLQQPGREVPILSASAVSLEDIMGH